MFSKSFLNFNTNLWLKKSIKIRLLINCVRTSCPILVLPVKESNLMRGSAAIAFPMSAPPLHKLATAPGSLFFSKTSATIFVVAMDTREVVSDPFQTIVSPHTWNETNFKAVVFQNKKIFSEIYNSEIKLWICNTFR